MFLTFSGNGIAGGFAGFFSGSVEVSCLTRLAAEGEDGSSVALRFPSAPVSVGENHAGVLRGRCADGCTYFRPSF